MSLSRKDYEAVAAVIDTARPKGTNLSGYEAGGHDALLDVAHDLANIFEASNPRFDRRRFLAACFTNNPGGS